MKVRALAGYRLYQEFEDGTAGVVSLRHLLKDPRFALLRDPKVFNAVHIPEWSVSVGWPTPEDPAGLDVAPETLYRWTKRAERREAKASLQKRIAALTARFAAGIVEAAKKATVKELAEIGDVRAEAARALGRAVRKRVRAR